MIAYTLFILCLSILAVLESWDGPIHGTTEEFAEVCAAITVVFLILLILSAVIYAALQL